MENGVAPVWLLGVSVDPFSLAAGVEHVRRSALGKVPFEFATPNLNFVRMMSGDEAFRESVLSCDGCLVDGMPLVWLGRLLGTQIPERVAGSSLFEALRHGSEPVRVVFFGGPPGAAHRASERISEEGGGLVGVGGIDPGFGTVESMSEPALIDEINALDADLLVVALGARKGHLWLARNRALLGAPVRVHLGAVVNFAAGSLRRAPVLWQKLGMEWLWRTIQEPALASRYALDALFLVQLVFGSVLPLLIWGLMRRGSRRTPRLHCDPIGTDGLLLEGALLGETAAQLRSALDDLEVGGGGWIDLDGVRDLDARGIGVLYEAMYRRTGRWQLRVDAPRVRRLLRWHRADALLERQKVTHGVGAMPGLGSQRAAVDSDQRAIRPGGVE